MILKTRSEWEAEYKKCLESPYYFATNYIQITLPDGAVVPFSTRLSEEEFNEITNRIHSLKDEIAILQKKKAAL